MMDAVTVRCYYRCTVANCEMKRHDTFAAELIVVLIGEHNHGPANLRMSNKRRSNICPSAHQQLAARVEWPTPNIATKRPRSTIPDCDEMNFAVRRQ